MENTNKKGHDGHALFEKVFFILILGFNL